MGKDSYMAQLPTQSQFGDYSEWPGRDVLDAGGQRLGAVREIYLDRETGRPEWVLVDVADGDARFVPLADANVEAWSIKVAHTAEKIKSAPGIGAEPRIDQSEERRLYAHYGLGYVEGDSGNDLRADDPPAPSGWGQKEEPSWQANTGKSPARESSTADTASWSTAAEPSNDAPPPAEPPSPAEIESAQIPDEPPAATDRGSLYETAPFGAVAPKDEPVADEPPAGEADTTATDEPALGTADTADEPGLAADDEPAPGATDAPTDDATADLPPADTAALGAVDAPPLFAEPAEEPPVGATDDRSPFSSDSAADALSPHAAPPADVLPEPVVVPDVTDPADLADPGAAPLDEPPLGTLDSPPADVPAALDSLAVDPATAPLPPVTADEPVSADTPPGTASIPKQPLGAAPPIVDEQGAPGGALERVKRDPKKVALAAVGAAVLFFIIRRLR